MKQGYFRHPTVHQDRVIFVSEDDLWTVPVPGGSPSRLTSNLSAIEFPRFSPDGRKVVIDSPHGDQGRQLHLIDISSIVG